MEIGQSESQELGQQKRGRRDKMKGRQSKESRRLLDAEKARK